MNDTKAHRAYVLLANGVRKPLKARGIVVELRPGIEIEIDLAPHRNFAGQLVLFTPPRSTMKAELDAGNADDFAVLFGGANVLHVLVDRRIRRTQNADAKKRSENQPAKKTAASLCARRSKRATAR
jgi:hypothetical protein